MAWIRSAINKAAEVPGGAIFRAAVRSYTDSVVQHAGYSVSGAASIFQDRIAPQNIQSFSDAAKRLEEVSVSCKGEERIQLLKEWLFALRESAKLNGSPVENYGKRSEDPHALSDKNVTSGKSAMILCHDPDLGSVPTNFHDVFLQSQALEGMTMSMFIFQYHISCFVYADSWSLTAGSLFCMTQIIIAPNEEEILLLHEIYGLCLTGGREVHDVVVKNIQDLAKAFSVYDSEMLVRREELLQFAQTAITGLKLTADMARIDSEISQIQQSLNRMKCHKSSGESSENSSEATHDTPSTDAKESVAHIQLCCRLKSLLLKKRLLKKGDTPQIHFQKVDKLKVLLESLHHSAYKTEKRVFEHREQKKEILTFCVARTSGVSQIEKDLEAEISVIEKKRDKLEAELRQVNSTLVAAITRLQNAREERLQFDEDNNEFFLHLKEKEDELSKTIVSYRAEADACNAFVNFLESTWAFQSSFVNQRDKQVNDQLQNHEAYIVNTVTSFLSTYKDQLELAIANLRKLLQSLKGYQYIIDPDDEFLHDIKQRINIEQEYLDAEAKVMSIFNAVESIKEHFYSAVDDASREDVEVINKLFNAIEKLKQDFKINKRPTLRIEIPTNEDLLSPATGSPQGVMILSPVRAIPDFKSIFSQNLIKSPRKKPYIPLGGSCENSPVLNMENDIKSTENKQHKFKVWESEKPSHFDRNVSNPTLKIENKTLGKMPLGSDKEIREQLPVSESQESKMHEYSKLDFDKDLVTSALEKETGMNTETTESRLGEISEALTAECFSGKKKSVDIDEELSKPISGIEEKGQVCTEDFVELESDEIVKETKDDNYHNKKQEISSAEHFSGNKKSVDPDGKLSKPNSGIKEKDQVNTEDIVGLESDEIVKEMNDDNYHNKKQEISPAEHVSGNKKSVDPDEKLSKPNSGIKEKDQVCTEDTVGLESDEIVKVQKDDNYHHKSRTLQWEQESVDPDEKLSEPNSGVEEKDLV
ncbi:hypothetical protein L1987_61108 [Smallanthus sonchifolius]|uniref:Uncharacterized protein n=1 Tax=Smallanthus sonchifolius TaxID=185202 RepID=A0ACB9D9W1_9ASTR|nr:hypothetical protein L1987_61108 [Smallanthus sonchifolius]